MDGEFLPYQNRLKKTPKSTPSWTWIALISLLSLEEASAKGCHALIIYFATPFWVSAIFIKPKGCQSFRMLGKGLLPSGNAAFPRQGRAWRQKVQNDNQIRRALGVCSVHVETLQSCLRELGLPRHAGILWKELKWQISQFPSFLAKINLSGWLVILPACEWELLS